jgi:integrase
MFPNCFPGGAMMRLTINSADKLRLKPGQKECIVFDEDIPGFGIRIREGGSRTWIFQYRVGSKQRRMVLGSASDAQLNLADTRKIASKLHGRVALGEDPAMDKATAKRDAENTLRSLAEQYLESRKPSWRPGTYREVVRHLNLHARPLHRIPIASVSQNDIVRLLDDIARKSGGATANKTRANLCALMGWVIKRGIKLPEGNVASYTEKPVQEQPRERVLSDTELRAIWNGCLDDHYGTIIKLLLLTGCRANEIGRLRWDELHDEQIILPGARTKNKRAHVVPLSEPAKAIVARLHRRPDRVCVFGRRQDTGFSGWSAAKRELDSRAKAEHWTVHDLRRTVATRMVELGVQPHIVEAVLNHVSGHKSGVAGIYNRATYDKEKREALNLWAGHVMATAEGRAATVVPLKRA